MIPLLARSGRYYARRSLLIVVLVLVHVIAFLQLIQLRPPLPPTVTTSGALQVRFIAAPDVPAAATAVVIPRAPTPREHIQQRPSTAIVVAPEPEHADTPTAAPIDWLAEARQSAAALAREEPSTQRSLGGERPEPQPERKPKPFGWDKTQTQRVEALPQGGLLIRLSDNCVLAITPIPLVGCGIGKRKARGDLFEGMQQPAKPGDWKDEGPP